MMPDLGAYATEILLAYAASLSLLGVLIIWIWARSRRVKRDLKTLETRLTRT
ncbi:MAG: heme exporter protein CcmD [Rhodobacteraceae bacterium]|jgi:heme exporter protein CcmD|nr:heme exporter protein CcmD [Paracoccaceae bacterium]